MSNKPEKENNAEILCIGTELLLGDIINSNAKFLSIELAKLGISHYRQTVVGDNKDRLKEIIIEASKRCRFLITTGGLGPTPDDLTTETIASAFNTRLEEREDIWREIKEKISTLGKTPTPNNRKQSLFPSTAHTIPNPIGTAPGMIWEPIKDFSIITFPGVPTELERMWKDSMVDWFTSNKYSAARLFSKTYNIFGISESSLTHSLSNLLEKNNPTIAPYASTGEVRLRVTAKAKDNKEAEKIISPIEKEILQKTGENCYGFNQDNLVSIVIDLLRKKNQTICVAESCTGGGISYELTAIPGASDVFKGGVVAYNNSIKQNLLQVPFEILEKHGAVSYPVVSAMALGAKKSLGADWCIATSGIAGPSGGSKSKPIGLVYFAIAGPGLIESSSKRFGSFRERASIQKLSVLEGLNRLRLLLLSQS